MRCGWRFLTTGEDLTRPRDTVSGLPRYTARAAGLGGDCVIESAPGKGTRVTARLPLGVNPGQDSA